MRRTTKPRARRIALLIESSHAIGRAILQGVSRFNRELGSPWSLYFVPHGLESSLPSWLRDWRGDGILVRLPTPQAAELLRASRVPIIELRGARPNVGFPSVYPDNRRIAQLAFEHLRSRGLREFAYFGFPRGLHYGQDQRCDEFRWIVQNAGFPCSGLSLSPKHSNPLNTTVPWERERERLIAWLRNLPKPIGILACCDAWGYQVLDARHETGLRVPAEVAVVGVDNDPVLCSLTIPALSSIDQNGELLGYEAAALLERIMAGQKPPTEPIVIEPRGLVARGSTEMFAFDDPDVTAALRFIEAHACEGIRVTDILKAVPLSQNELERRFHRYIGCSPKAELLRVQIKCAQELLRDTGLALAAIARQTGFSSEHYFSNAFFRQCGIRPSAYRQGHHPLSRR